MQIEMNVAASSFDTLLDRVEQGEEIEIARGGSIVAPLVPPERIDRQQAQAALNRIRNRAARFKAGNLDWDQLKLDRDEGRP